MWNLIQKFATNFVEAKLKIRQANANEQVEKFKLASKLVEKQSFENMNKKLLLVSTGLVVLYLWIDYVTHDNEL